MFAKQSGERSWLIQPGRCNPGSIPTSRESGVKVVFPHPAAFRGKSEEEGDQARLGVPLSWSGGARGEGKEPKLGEGWF